MLTVVILLLPVGVYVWGRYAGAFRVQNVVLTGVRRVPPKRALALLETRYRGRNLFTVSTGDVREQLATFPYFRGASQVDRDFPDTLRVTVTEYQPAAYLLTAGGWYVVAADGYVIAALPGGAERLRRRRAARRPASSSPASNSTAPSATTATTATATTAAATQSSAAAQRAAAEAAKHTLLAGPPSVAHPACRRSSRRRRSRWARRSPTRSCGHASGRHRHAAGALSRDGCVCAPSPWPATCASSCAAG